MHWQVMEKQHDVDMPLIIRDFIQSKHGKYRIESWSFDRNFGSPENREGLAEQVDCLVMPKKGRISKKEQKQQEEAEFKKYRKKHSTIEANINQLECLGAGKCRDKTIEGFKRYVGLSVLAYNLHRLGKIRRRY
ncbi:hypothetical protein M23134_05307 [Microscilla marina ATCC 23134]|uniref:Transposase DDE domain-containing protein n=2 Tax=Microscilla marina TaxID=1027 RepID=A1ZHG7_MICM2|nr:hypothetical protein M23134_05307 [Microscilla marina ATCC 23134]